MVDTQRASDRNDLLHRVVGALNDSGAEKETVDVVALIEVEGEPNNLVDRKPGAQDVVRSAVHAIRAVVDAVVGQEDLQQRDAATIWRIAVADPRGGSFVPGRFCRSAGGVVLRGIGQDFELFPKRTHKSMLSREGEYRAKPQRQLPAAGSS